MFLYGGLVLLLVSCKTSDKSAKTSGDVTLSGRAYLEEVVLNTPPINALSSKMKFTLNVGGQHTTVGGSLRIKRGDVIQLSIVPLLGIEVARVEISPDSVLIVDRMNKQYVSVSLQELPLLAGAEVDYHTLQSLFLNDYFLPGHQQLEASDLSSFTIKEAADQLAIHAKKGRKLNYSFMARLQPAQLCTTRIETRSKYHLEWQYADFKAFQGKDFPHSMSLRIEGTDKPLSAGFSLARLSADDGWVSRTTVSRKYKKVSAEELFKKLLKQ